MDPIKISYKQFQHFHISLFGGHFLNENWCFEILKYDEYQELQQAYQNKFNFLQSLNPVAGMPEFQ